MRSAPRRSCRSWSPARPQRQPAGTRNGKRAVFSRLMLARRSFAAGKTSGSRRSADPRFAVVHGALLERRLRRRRGSVEHGSWFSQACELLALSHAQPREWGSGSSGCSICARACASGTSRRCGPRRGGAPSHRAGGGSLCPRPGARSAAACTSSPGLRTCHPGISAVPVARGVPASA